MTFTPRVSRDSNRLERGTAPLCEAAALAAAYQIQGTGAGLEKSTENAFCDVSQVLKRCDFVSLLSFEHHELNSSEY
jgi:hypothetical protein